MLLLQLHGISLRGVSASLRINLAWYNSSDGTDGAIASGAYIFRCELITQQSPGHAWTKCVVTVQLRRLFCQRCCTPAGS